jgi:hypothetical protein
VKLVYDGVWRGDAILAWFMQKEDINTIGPKPPE